MICICNCMSQFNMYFIWIKSFSYGFYLWIKSFCFFRKIFFTRSWWRIIRIIFGYGTQTKDLKDQSLIISTVIILGMGSANERLHYEVMAEPIPRMISALYTKFCVFDRILTHLPLDKMAAILQKTFSDAFSWRKSFLFWLKFHWTLFLWVHLTITQHWFR